MSIAVETEVVLRDPSRSSVSLSLAATVDDGIAFLTYQPVRDAEG